MLLLRLIRARFRYHRARAEPLVVSPVVDRFASCIGWESAGNGSGWDEKGLEGGWRWFDWMRFWSSLSFCALYQGLETSAAGVSSLAVADREGFGLYVVRGM